MLWLETLTKRFGEKVAVDDLSLHIPPGELFALVGPNAAGKTTTVKMAVGLLRPDRGVIRIAGRDLRADPVAAKSVIGYVPDRPFLYERLTVGETLDFVASVYRIPPGERGEAKESVLRSFGLLGERGRLAGDLSHGFRQRLVFAMAMIHNPRLVIVDEPLVGLDPRSARTVKDCLKAKAVEGGAVFMCTHTLSVAEELADRIGILSRGRLIALGTLDQLRESCGGAGKLEEVFLRITAEHSIFFDQAQRRDRKK